MSRGGRTFATPLLPTAKAFRPVSGPKAQQELLEPRIAKMQLLLIAKRCKRLRRLASDFSKERFVCGMRKAAAVKIQIHIAHMADIIAKKRFRHGRFDIRQNGQKLAVIIEHCIEVNAVLRRTVGREHLETRANKRRRIRFEALNRKRLDACFTIGSGRKSLSWSSSRSSTALSTDTHMMR